MLTLSVKFSLWLRHSRRLTFSDCDMLSGCDILSDCEILYNCDIISECEILFDRDIISECEIFSDSDTLWLWHAFWLWHSYKLSISLWLWQSLIVFHTDFDIVFDCDIPSNCDILSITRLRVRGPQEVFGACAQWLHAGHQVCQVDIRPGLDHGDQGSQVTHTSRCRAVCQRNWISRSVKYLSGDSFIVC